MRGSGQRRGEEPKARCGGDPQARRGCGRMGEQTSLRRALELAGRGREPEGGKEEGPWSDTRVLGWGACVAEASRPELGSGLGRRAPTCVLCAHTCSRSRSILGTLETRLCPVAPRRRAAPSRGHPFCTGHRTSPRAPWVACRLFHLCCLRKCGSQMRTRPRDVSKLLKVTELVSGREKILLAKLRSDHPQTQLLPRASRTLSFISNVTTVIRDSWGPLPELWCLGLMCSPILYETSHFTFLASVSPF